VVVFVRGRERVSITCEISPEGGIVWWLTKESGQLPKCESPQSCWRCSKVKTGTEVLVQAYIVMKVKARCAVFEGGFDGVFFAPLEDDVLRVLWQTLLPLWDTARAQENLGEWHKATTLYERMTSALERGEYITRRDGFTHWLRCGTFTGLFPSHEDQFFTGITDAVGYVGSSRRPWLHCSGF
jgi:hypothetical protein